MASGCGKSPTLGLEPEEKAAMKITTPARWEARRILEEMERFEEDCRLYHSTGAVHTAKLLLPDGRTFVAEDLAQHHTLDKAVGKARLAGAETSEALLLLSGRLSSEIVSKGVLHRLPLLASRTASTCLGVKIAESFGLTLVGYVRKGRMTLYTHPERVVSGEVGR